MNGLLVVAVVVVVLVVVILLILAQISSSSSVGVSTMLSLCCGQHNMSFLCEGRPLFPILEVVCLHQKVFLRRRQQQLMRLVMLLPFLLPMDQ